MFGVAGQQPVGGGRGGWAIRRLCLLAEGDTAMTVETCIIAESTVTRTLLHNEKAMLGKQPIIETNDVKVAAVCSLKKT